MPSRGAARIYLAFLILLLAPALSEALTSLELPGVSATHPLSVAPFGASKFYADASAIWEVIRGGVSDALGARAYLVIAPDKGFTGEEVQALRARLARGGFSILIADETQAGGGLAAKLVGVVFGEGPVLNPDMPPAAPAALAVPVKCVVEGRVFTVYFVKAAYIQYYPKWMKPVCVAERVRTPAGLVEDAVMAVYGEVNGSKVLVVSDSSIFANYMYTGLPGYPPTRDLALALASLVAEPGERVVYDTSHLAVTRLTALAALTGLLAGTPAWALDKLAAAAAPILPYLIMAAVLGGILYLGVERLGARENLASRAEAFYFAGECVRSGLKPCPAWLTGPPPGRGEVEALAKRLRRLMESDGREARSG